MPRPTIAGLRTRFDAFEAWCARHWSVLGALLAFAILFGGVALAAHASGFASGTVTACLCGAAAIYFIRLYVRSVPAMQRAVDRLHPPQASQPARPDDIPRWAVVVYWLIAVALIFISMIEETYTYAVVELFIAFNAGRNVLGLFWPRPDGTSQFDVAFDVFDRWLDDFAGRHRETLGILVTVFGFAALFAGVALYAWQSGVTRLAAALCGPACLTTPGFEIIAVACGAAAILFVMFYTRLTLAVQRIFIDPFKFVRPEPKPEAAAKWVTVIHFILGFIVLFVVTAVGQMQTQHIEMKISSESPEGAALLLAWWIGGRIVLRFFWARWRRSEPLPRAA